MFCNRNKKTTQFQPSINSQTFFLKYFSNDNYFSNSETICTHFLSSFIFVIFYSKCIKLIETEFCIVFSLVHDVWSFTEKNEAFFFITKRMCFIDERSVRTKINDLQHYHRLLYISCFMPFIHTFIPIVQR